MAEYKGIFYSDAKDAVSIANTSAGIAESFKTQFLTGLSHLDTFYYTSGTASFDKVALKNTYGTLKAVRVRCLGGGGGGGSTTITAAGQNSVAGGGAGGHYAESFIMYDDLMNVSPITVGAKGLGATVETTFGTNGGTSSFGDSTYSKGYVAAYGGRGGAGASVTAVPAIGSALIPWSASYSAGQFISVGQPSEPRVYLWATVTRESMGGGNYMFPFNPLNPNVPATATGLNGQSIPTTAPDIHGIGIRGMGGGGGCAAQSCTTFKTGGNGSAGLVIVDLFG